MKQVEGIIRHARIDGPYIVGIVEYHTNAGLRYGDPVKTSKVLNVTLSLCAAWSLVETQNSFYIVHWGAK